jgi:hypothetical protein
MALWRPDVRTRMSTIDLQRGNAFRYTYSLGGINQFPSGSEAYLEIRNTYGQLLGHWDGEISGGSAKFAESAATADAIPAGSNFVLMISFAGDDPQQVLWGNVIRSQSPWPDAPPVSTKFSGVAYEYSFGTPGFVVDEAWRIMNGNPRVYNNSSASLPNAVAAGSLLSGDLALFDDVAMLWFAPLANDPVRLTYNVVKGPASAAGDAWVVICSNYDMTNSVAIHHTSGSSPKVAIATGTGPVTFTDRQSVAHTTSSLDNFTAEYNPASNLFSVYIGTNTTPLVSWPDTTHVVQHGEGERYVGFAFKSGALFPGIEISDWYISDTP